MEMIDTNISSLDKSNDENEIVDNLQQKPEEAGSEIDSKADIRPKDITPFVNDEDEYEGEYEYDDDDEDEYEGDDDDNANEYEDDQLQGGEEEATTVAAAAPAVDVNCLRCPPLAPSRDGLKAPPETQPDGMDAEDDKRLSVFLRIRPPSGAMGENRNEGSRNTIKVLYNSITAQGLPSTIQTYPPLNSNAPKVVRAGTHTSSDSSWKKSLASKSLVESNDDVSCDSGVQNAKVREVKEYSYSGVFGPNATQKDVYDNVAAPLVDGLFPKSSREDYLGESALLFTLGVTNAGKTHTVMGAGLEKHKCASNKNSDMGGAEPHKEWGIIPRSLHDLLSRIKSMNTANPSEPQLQLYMSYLELYNEQIYDLLPEKSEEKVPKHFNFGPPALKLRESRHGRIFVRGLTRRLVNSVEQGLEYAEEAKNNRHTTPNNINANSSRSHSICQFEIAHAPKCSSRKGVQSDTGMDSECKPDGSSSGSKKTSKRKSTNIWIVDLDVHESPHWAGSIEDSYDCECQPCR